MDPPNQDLNTSLKLYLIYKSLQNTLVEPESRLNIN